MFDVMHLQDHPKAVTHRSLHIALALALTTFMMVHSAHVSAELIPRVVIEAQESAPPQPPSLNLRPWRWHLPVWQTWAAARPLLKPRSRAKLLSTLSLDTPSRWTRGYVSLPEPSELRALWGSSAASLRDPRGVMIIGDSLSATEHYLRCFREPSKHGSRDEVARLLDELRAQGERGVFTQESYATQPGATSWRLLSSEPLEPTVAYGRTRRALRDAPEMLKVPLLRELYESDARIATVLLGTNDVRYRRGPERFATHYLMIVNTLLDAGVLPILSTLPPQKNKALDAQTLVFNQIIRTIAAASRVPLMSLRSALIKLSSRGLRRDGVHLNAYRGGCALSERGLRFGQNKRNWVTLLSLLETRRALGELGDRVANTTNETANETAIERPGAVKEEAKRGAHRETLEGPPELGDLHTAPVWVSEVTSRSPSLSGSPCATSVKRHADRAKRWRRFRPAGPYTMTTPRHVYGEWRVEVKPLKIARRRQVNLVVMGAFDHPPELRPDPSREQFWMRLASGRCVALRDVHQRVALPRGEHELHHYARFGDLDKGYMSDHHNATQRSIERRSYRALVSWE